jgi:hypothetical protein
MFGCTHTAVPVQYYPGLAKHGTELWSTKTWPTSSSNIQHVSMFDMFAIYYVDLFEHVNLSVMLCTPTCMSVCDVVHVNLHVSTRPHIWHLMKSNIILGISTRVESFSCSHPPFTHEKSTWVWGLPENYFHTNCHCLEFTRCTVGPGVVLAGSFPHTIATGYPVEPDLCRWDLRRQRCRSYPFLSIVTR